MKDEALFAAKGENISIEMLIQDSRVSRSGFLDVQCHVKIFHAKTEESREVR